MKDGSTTIAEYKYVGPGSRVLEERLPAISLWTGVPAVMSRLEVHPEDAERALAVLAEVEELDEASE